MFTPRDGRNSNNRSTDEDPGSRDAALARVFEHRQFGDFTLTDAVRPSPNSGVTPREGYRINHFLDPQSHHRIPRLAASVSAEKLWDIFTSSIDLLNPVVTVVLETSHLAKGGSHKDLMRDSIDLPVLCSYLEDPIIREMLLHDGCTGIAIFNETAPDLEVQLDGHKMIVVYGETTKALDPFVEIMRAAGIFENHNLRFITEAEHIHYTDPNYWETFQQLCASICAEEQTI